MKTMIGIEHTAPYSWFARGKDRAGRDALGGDSIPILRVRKGENFQAPSGLYRDTVEISRAVDQPDWWLKPGPSMDAWRSGLKPDALVALRFFKDDDTKNGGTGRWLGIYRVRTARLSEIGIEVQLDPERLWSIRQ